MVTQEHIGQLVGYWNNGYRYGYLVRIDNQNAYIKNVVKKRETKVLAKDCNPCGDQRNMGNSIYDELFKFASAKGFQKQSPGQSDDEHITKLVRAIGSLPKDDWDRIAVEAKVWFNSAVNPVNRSEAPPLCPGFHGLDAIQKAEQTKEPPKGLSALEVLAHPTPSELPAVKSLANKPKRQPTGLMEALRRTVILHPEWKSRQVYDYLKLNGFPEAKIDTISVDGGNIRRVIEMARQLGKWKEQTDNGEVLEAKQQEESHPGESVAEAKQRASA